MDIKLADNIIETSVTTFQVGVPYTFVIANDGRRAHNFNINPPVSVAGSLDAALDSALLVVPQEQLAPGESARVEFTFPDSAEGQLLEFSCLSGGTTMMGCWSRSLLQSSKKVEGHLWATFYFFNSFLLITYARLSHRRTRSI